jgi:hypothetical protein
MCVGGRVVHCGRPRPQNSVPLIESYLRRLNSYSDIAALQ